MKITIKDCDLAICKELDLWLSNEKILNHAMFDQTFTDEYKYYHNEKNGFDEKIFEKVIYIDNMLMAYVVLIYYEENGIKEVAFNPIVINPIYHNQGYGKKILNHLINYIELIINEKVDFFNASISINNEISIKLFTSLGFKQIGACKDKTYIYYGLKNDESNKYR